MATGALSDKQIMEEYIKKNIVITDFHDENLGNCSYDVTLGKHFYVCAMPKDKVYNPYTERSTRNWSLCEATTVEKWEEFEPISKKESCQGIKDTDLVIWLHPRKTILAHTNEFIGAKKNITTMMKARSSIGRNFIQVCHCSGWGDIGYVNRWTMEISNNSDYFIPLVVGTRVAQIVFFYTGDCLTSYDKKKSAKYQREYSNIEEMQKAWKPEHMLPRLYLDAKIPSVQQQRSMSGAEWKLEQEFAGYSGRNRQQEDKWKQKLFSQFGVTEPIQGKSYEETWKIYNTAVVYTFNLSFYLETYFDASFGYVLQGKRDIVDTEEIHNFYDGAFAQDLEDDIRQALTKYPIARMDRYVLDVNEKTLEVRVSAIDLKNSFQIGDELKLAIEREHREEEDREESMMYYRRVRVETYLHKSGLVNAEVTEPMRFNVIYTFNVAFQTKTLKSNHLQDIKEMTDKDTIDEIFCTDFLELVQKIISKPFPTDSQTEVKHTSFDMNKRQILVYVYDVLRENMDNIAKKLQSRIEEVYTQVTNGDIQHQYLIGVQTSRCEIGDLPLRVYKNTEISSSLWTFNVEYVHYKVLCHGSLIVVKDRVITDPDEINKLYPISFYEKLNTYINKCFPSSLSAKIDRVTFNEGSKQVVVHVSGMTNSNRDDISFNLRHAIDGKYSEPLDDKYHLGIINCTIKRF